jgi:hypothetical protein
MFVRSCNLADSRAERCAIQSPASVLYPFDTAPVCLFLVMLLRVTHRRLMSPDLRLAFYTPLHHARQCQWRYRSTFSEKFFQYFGHAYSFPGSQSILQNTFTPVPNEQILPTLVCRTNSATLATSSPLSKHFEPQADMTVQT